MKFKWAAVAAILALAAGCHKTDWKTFAPEGGNFSVLMPGEPQDASHTRKTPQGNLTSHLYLYSSKGTAYAVSYLDRPASKDTATPEQILDSMRDAEVAKSGGKLLGTSSIKLPSGAPGREIQVSITQGDGKHAMRDRIFLVNNRLYQVMAVVPSDQLDAPDTLKYLNSFTVK
jgi:hypothetical protein